MKKVIDGDNIICLEKFDEKDVDLMMVKYQSDDKWQDVSLDCDGDIILYRGDLECEHIDDEKNECKKCGKLICEKCQAEYNQFTQIDYNCCKECADNK